LWDSQECNIQNCDRVKHFWSAPLYNCCVYKNVDIHYRCENTAVENPRARVKKKSSFDILLTLYKSQILRLKTFCLISGENFSEGTTIKFDRMFALGTPSSHLLLVSHSTKLKYGIKRFLITVLK
jgi:hypothetical protein